MFWTDSLASSTGLALVRQPVQAHSASCYLQTEFECAFARRKASRELDWGPARLFTCPTWFRYLLDQYVRIVNEHLGRAWWSTFGPYNTHLYGQCQLYDEPIHHAHIFTLSVIRARKVRTTGISYFLISLARLPTICAYMHIANYTDSLSPIGNTLGTLPPSQTLP